MHENYLVLYYQFLWQILLVYVIQPGILLEFQMKVLNRKSTTCNR